jgi:hypothetical protein
MNLVTALITQVTPNPPYADLQAPDDSQRSEGEEVQPWSSAGYLREGFVGRGSAAVSYLDHRAAIFVASTSIIPTTTRQTHPYSPHLHNQRNEQPRSLTIFPFTHASTTYCTYSPPRLIKPRNNKLETPRHTKITSLKPHSLYTARISPR